MPTEPLIALISATPAAIKPAVGGLAHEFPAAAAWNLLDDRLLKDANQAGGLTPELEARMQVLVDYAKANGADAVLLTCSMYGPVAHSNHSDDFPVLASDDAAFAAAVDLGVGRLLVVASFAAALRDTEQRLQHHLSHHGSSTGTTGVVAEAAFDASLAGDRDALLVALQDAVAPLVGEVDAVLLAQYSLAPAAAALQESLGIPVLSGPASAARLLHRFLVPATVT